MSQHNNKIYNDFDKNKKLNLSRASIRLNNKLFIKVKNIHKSYIIYSDKKNNKNIKYNIINIFKKY